MRRTTMTAWAACLLTAGCATVPVRTPAMQSTTPAPEPVLAVPAYEPPAPGGGAAPADAPIGEDDAPGRPPSPKAGELLLLTPGTTVRFGAATNPIPPDTYTRLVVTSVNGSETSAGERRSEEDEKVYPYRMRSPIERFFVGTHHSATLSAKVASGSFVATVPLITVSHDSTRGAGEAFNRTLRHEAQDFPMFLVRGSGNSDIASVTFDLKGADSVDSAAAGVGLSAVVAATKFVAPQAALLTTLSAPAAKDIASSIDSAISKLFAMSLVEEHAIDQPVRAWRDVTVTLRLPRSERGWNDRKDKQGHAASTTLRELDYVGIGSWTIRFSRPRVSIFATPTVACPARIRCDAVVAAARRAALAELSGHTSDALAFPLLRDGSPANTIGSYLRQLDWWAVQLKALDGARADGAPFCRMIRDAMLGLGFNALDAAIVVDGVARSAMLDGKAVQALAGAQECTLPAA